MQKKGKTDDFIGTLLLDAQKWSDFRARLQLHVREADNLVQNFRSSPYLCDEVSLGSRDGDNPSSKRGRKAIKTTINNLSTIIQEMGLAVEKKLAQLDLKTQRMIELVSIAAESTESNSRLLANFTNGG